MLRRSFLSLAFAKSVKITGVEIYNIRIPVSKDEAAAGVNFAYNVVEVATDAGVTGYSFAGPGAGQLPAVRQLLVGRDVFGVEGMLAGGLIKWGGVEHAVWDAIGKIAGQPAYKLLGGAKTRVPAYLTCVWRGKLDQSHVPYRDQADMAVKIKKAGFKGMKIRAWRPQPMDDVDACAEIMRAVGSEFSLMFDRTAHAPQSVGQKVWDFETGLKVSRGLEKAGAAWIEEPYARDDYESPAKLAAMLDMPVTGGEGYQGTEAYKQCLLHRTYDILQPDGRNVGGIFLCRKVATMAEAFHVPVILHGTMGLMLAGWLQATLAIGAPWQEVALISPPLLPAEQWAPGLRVLKQKEMFQIENGELVASELPGIGLDVNAEALREFRVTA